jgi:type IV pilus assembly protein PilN
VYLTSVEQTDKRLKFQGIAQSSTRVSTFMRALDGSQWLHNPELLVVETSKTSSGSSFTLTADQVTTSSDDNNPGKRGMRKASAGAGAQ